MEEERYVPLSERPVAESPAYGPAPEADPAAEAYPVAEAYPAQEAYPAEEVYPVEETCPAEEAGEAERAFPTAETAPYVRKFEPVTEEQPYEQLFTGEPPAEDDAFDGAEGGLPEDEEFYDEDGYVFTWKELEKESAETDWRDVKDPEEREKLLARRDFFRTLSGVSDVVLVFVLTGVILVLIWLIVALIRYVETDLPERFTLLRHLSGLPRGGEFLG